MTEHKLQRLPVLDDNGRLIGVLTSSDIMRDLLRVTANLPPAKDSEAEDDE